MQSHNSVLAVTTWLRQIVVHSIYQYNMSSFTLSSNSDAIASDLLENLEEMPFRY